MEEEFYEESVYEDASEEKEDFSSVEDDEISAEEEGFLKGYNEANDEEEPSEEL